MARVKFRRFLDKDDFTMGTGDTDVTLVASKWTEIASYQVPAQQEIAFGAGMVSDNGVDSRETATIKLYDATTQFTAGKLRLAYADANSVTVQPIHEDLLSNWSSGVKLAELTNLRVREDSYLKIFVNCALAHIVDVSTTSNQIDVPVTTYML